MSTAAPLGRADAIRLLFADKRVADAERLIQSEIVALLALGADQCHAAGLVEKADQYARALMLLYPRQSDGYRLAMSILLDARRYSDAAPICLRAVEHCHADAGLCAELIGTVYGLGLYEQALQASRLQIQKQPRRLDAYLLAAQCSVALERFDQASQCLVQGQQALPQAAGWLRVQLDYLAMTVESYQQRQGYPLYDVWRCGYQFRSQQLEPPSIGRPDVSDLIAIQYWSQPDPPEDVRALTSQWNGVLAGLGLAPIRLFDKLQARSWIAECAPLFLTAFDSAPHYCSESDVFRIAFSTRHSVMYIDSDMVPTQKTDVTLGLLLARRSSALYVYRPTPFVQNAFLVAWRGCPYFARISDHLAGFDYGSEALSRHSMFELIHNHSFGPGIFNRVLRSFCDSSPPQHCFDPAYPLGACRKLHRGPAAVVELRGFRNYPIAAVAI